eukprot:6179982-Pleurochrysis_carterae.AAC.1
MTTNIGEIAKGVPVGMPFARQMKYQKKMEEGQSRRNDRKGESKEATESARARASARDRARRDDREERGGLAARVSRGQASRLTGRLVEEERRATRLEGELGRLQNLAASRDPRLRTPPTNKRSKRAELRKCVEAMRGS